MSMVVSVADGGAGGYAHIGDRLAGIPLRRGRWGRWWLAMAAAGALTLLLIVSLGFLFWQGTAVWGNNIPVTWALDIVSYDWWIGIASGGLLVSGMFLLTDTPWRGAVNRLAEAMALLAAAAAAVYPIVHLGRPWFFYWNLPYPNTFALWPQFRSPLYWDAIDIVSFLGLASGLFYVGLLPDLASLRDSAWVRAQAEQRGMLRAQLYGIAALGWRGSAVHWHRWVQTYRTLALLAVLVVIALQIGASVMFAGTVEPGWHDTLLPVRYLVSALFAGVGMLSVLAVVLRDTFALQDLITERHLRALGWLLLALGLAAIYCEAATTFVTLLGGETAEIAALARRATGPVAWSFWMMVTAALLPPLLFLIPAARGRPGVLAWVGGAAAAGIWCDHYTLIVASLQHDFLPSAAGAARITLLEWTTFIGSGGLFLLLLLLFLRFLPVMSLVELRASSGPPGSSVVVEAPHSAREGPLWGVAAVFSGAAPMVAALRALASRGGMLVDGYSPVPAAGAARVLGPRRAHLAAMAWAGGAAGAAAMFGMCVYATAYDYVFDIGGRPRFSWPAFVVPSASFGCLCAGMAAVIAMLVSNRMPRLNHPAFNIPDFPRATQDRFFAVAHWNADGSDPTIPEGVLAGLPDAPLAIYRVAR